MTAEHLKPHSRRHSSAGFTIIELMVAMSVFAAMLLILAAGVIHFTNDYFRSVTQTKTQTVARNVANDIAASIEFGRKISQGQDTTNTYKYLCVDNTMYVWQVNPKPIGPGNPHALMRNSSATDCTPQDFSTGVELLGSGMQVSVLDIAQDPATKLWSVHVRVASGDNTLLSGPQRNLACNSGAGSQFCAVSDVTTVVMQRIGN